MPSTERLFWNSPVNSLGKIFDSKVFDLLYAEYRFHDAHFVEADTLDALIAKLDGVNHATARVTLTDYNDAVDIDTQFDPTVLDAKGTKGLVPPKSNWAQKIDQGPYRAFPVTGGITFTYGGLKVDADGSVISTDGAKIAGLFACGEIVGGGLFRRLSRWVWFDVWRSLWAACGIRCLYGVEALL